MKSKKNVGPISTLIIGLLLSFFIAACGGSSATEAALREEIAGLKEQIRQTEKTGKQGLAPGKIKHTVMFNLKYQPDALEATKFLQDGERILTAIPTVENFRVFRQISPKNGYRYCFSMVFADKAGYQAYNDHPEHVKFVKERWDTEVSEFLEADFEVFDGFRK